MRYSYNDRQTALDLWFSMAGEISLEDFVAELGYPSLSCMGNWVRSDPRNDPDRPTYKSKAVLTKLEAIRRVADGEPRAAVGRSIGASGQLVGSWAARFAEGGTAALLPQPRKRKGADVAGRKKGAGRAPAPVMSKAPASALVPASELPDDPAALKAMVAELQMDNAILREVLDVLKADPGCDPADLTGGERAGVAAALEGRFPLAALLARLGLPRSTYYYQLEALTRPDDDDDWLGDAVEAEFRALGCSRGYRAVWKALQGRGGEYAVSEKRVRDKMRERGLAVCYAKRPKRYSSYAGEPDERPANLPLLPDGRHDFRAGRPNEKWASDITEFRLPDDPRKVYLSPVLDLFDLKPVGFAVSTSPDAELADSSLEMACAQLRPGERPFCHTDGGAHYRWPGWKRICEDNGVTRSMSRKGRSPDNAACEGFFGTLKNEMFYGSDWSGWTAEEFMGLLVRWMRYYSEERIKYFKEDGKVVYDTIDARRRRLGFAA